MHRWTLLFFLLWLPPRTSSSSTLRAISTTDPYPLLTISIPQDTSSMRAALQIIKSKPADFFRTDRINQITIALAPSSSPYYGGMENCALNISTANVLGFSQQQQGRFVLIKFTTQSSSSNNSNGDDNLAVIDCGGLNSRFMAIQGPGYKDSDLSSSSSSTDRMNVVIERLDIRNGKFPNPVPPVTMGGGCIFGTNQASLRIEKSKISGCWAVNGGGVMVAGRSSLVLMDSLIKNNGGVSQVGATANNYGGGVCGRDSSMYVEGCIFESNWMVNYGSFSSQGAALTVFTASAATLDTSVMWCIINQTTFTGNSILGIGVGRIYAAGVYCYYIPCSIFSSFFTNNSLVTNADAYSGAVALNVFGISSFVISNSTLQLNSALIAGRGTIEGGAMSIIQSTAIVRHCIIRENMIQSTGYSSLSGGSIHIYLSNVNMSQSLVESNVVKAFSFVGKNCSSLLTSLSLVSVSSNGTIASAPFILPFILTASSLTLTDEIANFKACKATQTITDECGVISDGYALYPANLDCTWNFNAPIIAQIRLRYVFSIIRLSIDTPSTGCTTDYLQIYDGPSTTSTMIGQYCVANSPNPIVCVSGACPSFDNILTSSGSATIIFHSDSSAFDPTKAGGFILTWKMIDQATVSPPLGSSATTFSSFTRSPAGRGGALHTYGGQVIIFDSIIRNNSIDHPLAAIGGAVLVRNAGSLKSINSIFSMNSVSGSAATGGAAIAAIEASSITIISSNIANNINTASGSCFKYGSGVECASGWGGGLLIAQASAGRILSSRIEMNSVMCSGDDSCAARGGGIVIAGTASSLEIGQGSMIISNSGLEGGGIGVIEDGKMVMSTKTQCINNTVAVLATSSLSSSSRRSSRSTGGGCIWANSASTLTIDESEMSMNNGDGSGGAIYILDSCQMNMTRSINSDNTATQGGAMWINTRSSVAIRNSTFKENQATVSGGAIGASLVHTLTISDNSSFIDNAASQASILWVADQSASIQISSSNIISSDPGNWVNCVGDLAADMDTSWHCSYEGTVFNMQYQSGSYFGLSCDVCNEGTYSANEASESGMNAIIKCESCPFGAQCHPAERNASGVFSIGGYWGLKSTGVSNPEIKMFPCLSGYCCEKFGDSSDDRRCKYDQCSGGRNGTLCGQCPDGYGFSFFSSACGPNEHCKDAGWAIPLAILGAFLFVAFLLITSRDLKDSDGWIAVVLFFYQVAPMVKSSPWKYINASVMGSLQAIFSLSPPDGGNNENDGTAEGYVAARNGICIWPEMKTSHKLGAKMLFQGLIFVAIVLVMTVHFVCSRYWKSNRFIRPPPSWTGLYGPAAARFFTIAYTTLVLTPMQMIQCVKIESGLNVWWWDGGVECFQSWQYGAIAAIAILAPIPLVVILMTWNHSTFIMSTMSQQQTRTRGKRRATATLEKVIGKWRLSMDEVLTAGYRQERRWWLGISLYRRFILVLAYTMITNRVWLLMAMICLCSCFTVLHVVSKPFAFESTNRAETAMLLCLTILSATSSPQLARSFFGSAKDVDYEKELEIIQLIVMILPGAAFVIHRSISLIELIKNRMSRLKQGEVIILKKSDEIIPSSSSSFTAPTKTKILPQIDISIDIPHACELCQAWAVLSKEDAGNDDDSGESSVHLLARNEIGTSIRTDCPFHQFC